MFENLTDRLSQTLRHVTGKAKLTEDNIKDTLREVRMALLEADVALPVVRDFVARVKERAVGQEVAKAGSSGRSTGAHVHFEVWENGRVVNPRKFLGEGPTPVGQSVKRG